jgi:hypothetical protein
MSFCQESLIFFLRRRVVHGEHRHKASTQNDEIGTKHTQNEKHHHKKRRTRTELPQKRSGTMAELTAHISCLKTISTFSDDDTYDMSCSDFTPRPTNINGKKKLAWKSLEVIEFPIVLGTHPCVSQGAPIEMGRQEISRQIFDLYQYEVLTHCAGDVRQKRRGDALKLSAPERASILLQAGYTVSQIVDSTQQATEYRKLRQESLKNETWDRVNETVGRTARKVMKVLTLNAKSA